MDDPALLVFVGTCLGVGAGAARATANSVKTWYPALRKPPGTPRSWLFGPVWTCLYMAMGTAAWLVWRSGNSATALAMFAAQLLLNAAWSYIFFGLRRAGTALLELVLLWMAVLITAMLFRQRSIIAFRLMMPYLGWTSYAAYLNLGIWRLNDGGRDAMGQA